MITEQNINVPTVCQNGSLVSRRACGQCRRETLWKSVDTYDSIDSVLQNLYDARNCGADQIGNDGEARC